MIASIAAWNTSVEMTANAGTLNAGALASCGAALASIGNTWHGSARGLAVDVVKAPAKTLAVFDGNVFMFVDSCRLKNIVAEEWHSNRDQPKWYRRYIGAGWDIFRKKYRMNSKG